MWVYIVILTLAIIILWGYFFKSYWLAATVKEPDAKEQGWGEMLNEIKQSVNQGSQVFKQVKEDLKNLSLPAEAIQNGLAATSSASTAATQAELIEKLKNKLEQTNNP